MTPDNLSESQWHDQELTLVPTHKYRLPNRVQHTPLPLAEASYIVADSKMQLTQKLSASVSATPTFGAFTATLKASYSGFNETKGDRWYCYTNGSQTIYNLHASHIDLKLLHLQVTDNDIYTTLMAVLDMCDNYNDADQEVYVSFFN